MDHAGSRAHVSGHIHCCPFEWSHHTFSDHWLQTVVFYALYLMVPLLERHFHLAWHSFAAESVYMRDTKLQSHGQCVYKMPHIFIRLSRGWRLREVVLWVPTLHLVGWKQGVKVVVLQAPTLHLLERWPPGHPHQDPHFPQDFPKGSVVGPWGCIQRATSWQRSSMSCHNSSATRSPRFTCNWHGVLPHRWGSLGDNWCPSFLSGIGCWVPEGSPSITTI